MSYSVKCFRYDQWVDVDVSEIVADDIFSFRGQTYVATGKVVMDGNTPQIPSKRLESDTIVLNFDSNREFITMAMDYVGSGAQEFEDGTIIICELASTDTCVYSPRLPVNELNAFCREHLKHYQAFYDTHKATIEDGGRVAMEKFW